MSAVTRETTAMTTNRPRHLRRVAVAAAITLLAFTGGASAATSKELLDCQKALESNVRGYSNVIYQKLYTCAQKVVECELASEIDAVDPTACLARAAKSCTGPPAKLGEQAAKRKAKTIARCGLIPLAELEQYDEGLGFFNVVASCGAASVNDLVDCVFADAQCGAERELFRLDPRAQDSLTTAGVAASFPCVAP
jgi:hypothetical protein